MLKRPAASREETGLREEMSSSDEEPTRVPDEVNIAFLKAAAVGDMDVIRSSLEAGAQTAIRDKEGLTPLMLAANSGKADAVELLLANKANPNLQSYVIERRRPGHMEVCSRLEMQIGMQRQVGCKFTALHFAILSGSAAAVDALLKAPGVNVNLQADRDGNELSPLHIATALGMESFVKSLLAITGIAVNLVTVCEDTALDLARYPHRRVGTLEGFMQVGEPPDFKEAGPAYPSIAALLEEAGGKIYADNNVRWPSEEQLSNLQESLRDRDETPNEAFENYDGLTWKLAAIKLGIDVHPAGKAPLILRAAYFTCRTLVKALVEAGADVNATNQTRTTALHIALRNGNVDTVEYLLEQGADVNAKDEDGSTPLGIAEQWPTMAYLLKQASS